MFRYVSRGRELWLEMSSIAWWKAEEEEVNLKYIVKEYFRVEGEESDILYEGG